METWYYEVASIDGDYANLKRTDIESDDLKLVARALLPPEIMEGSRLKYELMQYEIIAQLFGKEVYTMDVRKMRNEKLGARVVAALESRNMEAYYVETKEEAVKKALELIPKGSSINMGGATLSLIHI